MTDQVVLPDKQEQFKLNEVCKLANVQPYMLRFWGTEFPQLEASKSGTGQRLYSRDQVLLILEIRRLLFDEGLTIAGARKKVATMDIGEAKPKKAKPKAEPEPEPQADDVFTDEPEEKKAEETKPKPKIKTSSARRKSPKKEAAPKPKAEKKVDKKPTDDVQPLLATLKSVRDEIDKIVTELKSE
jgi:DNA-binding transcriptional MerR regulator